MPGVVSLPYGWGHDRPGLRLSVAQEHAGASLNDVADERLFDHVTGTTVLDGIHGVLPHAHVGNVGGDLERQRVVGQRCPGRAEHALGEEERERLLGFVELAFFDRHIGDKAAQPGSP